jgi:hypothetical protein
MDTDNIAGCELAAEVGILVSELTNRRDENVCISKIVSLLSILKIYIT